ncbi:hypothetical protein [Falsiroseomonas sp. CW058]|uniref:hypothetical protein n=1 Tax=Falsiroseomonas sp. CW058 TaxID=3388664 RepID=UPI003D3155F4
MRSPFPSIPDRPGLVALALASLLLLGAAGDIAAPLLPAVPILLALSLLGLGAGLVLARRRPGAGWPRGLSGACAILALGFGLLAALQHLAGTGRGFLAARFDAPAALQDALIGPSPGTPREAAELRAALALPDASLRPRPASADEFLYNALLLRARDEPVRAALSLAEALRRAPEPRPDAMLLQAGLLAGGLPAVREALSDPPASLSPSARAHLAALALPPAGRAAALAELLAREPDRLLLAADLARALLAASLPQGPTIATARRIAAALDLMEDADRAEPFAAAFLDPAGPARLGQELADLAWVRDVATRRLGVAALAPPPGMPNAPILVRVTPPEPATAVQFLRTVDAQGEVWADIPQRTDDTREAARDPVPTLRLMRPHRVQPMRFRYLDRDGVASDPVEWTFDPAQAMRDAAQRALQRQGAFALYQPGRVARDRLNPLPIAGQFRAGLAAVEWFTDADGRPRSVAVGIPDEAVLAGEAQRTLVEFSVPQGARTLFLAAVYADGSRSAVAELPIR